MEKLVSCIMGQDCENFIRMSLKSVKASDVIIYCDGGSSDNTLKIIESEFKDVIIIKNKYDKKNKKMNGIQRNFYLNYLKENYSNDWCLCIDADEVVEDISKIKDFIQVANKGLYSVKMRHFIQDLSHEDSTYPVHYVPRRLFKISETEQYPEVEHPVLEGNFIGNINVTTIWHLAYIPNLWSIKKRYENHLEKSNIHTKDFLDEWYRAHIFGAYPKKRINLIDIPEIILNEFGIDKDELYFKDRNIEVKHFLMTKQWIDFFKLNSKSSVIEFGCGKAPFGFVFNYLNLDYKGVEKSNYAVNKSFIRIEEGDILNYNSNKKYDLVLAIDVLEHINYNDLDKAIQTLIKHSDGNILVSIPFIGDPNLEADKTHIIKETREWWILQFEKHNLKIKSIPNDFLFGHQLLVFEK